MLELAGVLILGIFAQWFAWKVKVPAILPLIIIGLLVGPISTYLMPTGDKFIDTDKIFQGELLFDFLSLAVGVILFEGGLSLKIKELKGSFSTVANLIIIGTIVTFIGASVASYYIMDLELKMALLFGSLVIVTGPTVIKPILRNVRPNKKVATILKWEGVLIDPVGALIALLVYEFIIYFKADSNITLFAFKEIALTIVTGTGVGLSMASLIYYLLKKELIPTYLRNVVVLALVVFTIFLSDTIIHESGLFAVTLLGITLTNTKLKQINFILSFKEDITVILISVLFIMLSARIDMEDIQLLGLRSIILFIVVVYLLRPLSIFLSSFKSKLSINEKLFLSWISPRGIVAAGVASIFTIRIIASKSEFITAAEREDAELILPLTFLIIIGTVIIQGATAKKMAKTLNVIEKQPNGILFIGADEMTRMIALFMKKLDIPILLSDTSQENIRSAKVLGLETYQGSLLIDKTVTEDIDLTNYGQMWAMTSSSEINMLGGRILTRVFGEDKVFRLSTKREFELKELSKPKNLLFNGELDFLALMQIMRMKPGFKSITIELETEWQEILGDEEKTLLFYLDTKGQIVPFTSQSPKPRKGDEVVYVSHSK
ncbi:MAG: cation:proton antiporter [Cyclobacteriaceae bacterium]